MSQKTVLAFGTFDEFHPGHEYFLKNAAKLGDNLIVGVARDTHVLSLKEKHPKQSEEERMQTVLHLPYVSKVVLCDKHLGGFQLLKLIEPDVIAIGHDQTGLRQSLQAWMEDTGTVYPLTTIGKYDGTGQ